MTKRECAIVMAYTGTCMLQGDDLKYFYDYVKEKLPNRVVYTHDFMDMETELQEASKVDFIRLCANAV